MLDSGKARMNIGRSSLGRVHAHLLRLVIIAQHVQHEVERADPAGECELARRFVHLGCGTGLSSRAFSNSTTRHLIFLIY